MANAKSESPLPLVVRIRNWVGDVVLGLPALRLLQEHGYALHLVARGGWAPTLLAGYDWPVFVQPKALKDKVAQLRGIARECAKLDTDFKRRDNALLLPVSFSSALEMRLAGLRAVGVAKEGRSILLARALPWAQTGHELERYWDVACRFLGVQKPLPANINFQVAPSATEQATQLLAAHGVQGRFVMVCPFAAGRAATADKADKKWPAFAEFVRQGSRQLGLPLLVYPGPGEHAAARDLYPAAQMLEGSNLAVYAALLQRAALVVANDTGPAHMAAALGSPLISLMGPTDAARWAPWGHSVHILQRPARDGHTDWPHVQEALTLAQKLLHGSS